MRLSKRCFSSGFMALLVALVTSGADPAATMAAPGTSAAGIAPTPAPEVHVNVKMLADVKAVQAGHPFKLGVELEMDPGWHTYYKECGDAGMPTRSSGVCHLVSQPVSFCGRNRRASTKVALSPMATPAKR